MSRVWTRGALLLLLQLAACAPLWSGKSQPGNPSLALIDSLGFALSLSDDLQSGLLAARWHLLRAHEEQAGQLYDLAQQDLDRALRILAELEAGAAEDTVALEQVEHLRSQVEKVYLAVLPRLEHLSPDSPLRLLLEGLSEEKMEDLPADAGQFVRLHQLARQCDVPIDLNPRVLASIHFFQNRGRATYANWLRRAGRYREMILEVLRAEGLPNDLLFIAMIESGFNPRAYSRAHAVGMWQFIEGTGRLEGLANDYWVDERRDPFKSTCAAARHLKGLHQALGDWRLAAAAYNAGRGRVERAIERTGTRDYWRLDLPQETRNYVPLFMAAALIAKAPEQFGFEDIRPDPPVRREAVPLAHSIQLGVAARCLDLEQGQLRELNPELRQSVTPPRGQRDYRLWVPPGKAQSFLGCYARLSEKQKLAWREYRVKRRDTISTIAKAFGVAPQTIARANKLKNLNRIHPGQKLYIPTTASPAGLANGPPDASAGDEAASPQIRSASYHVKRGDSLSRIARAHGVTVQDLKKWNRLKGNTIRPGDWLVTQSALAAATIARAPAKSDPQAGRPAAQTAQDQQQYTVRSGETLWDISKRFKVAVADLRSWNRLKRGDALRPGQQLIVNRLAPRNVHVYTVVKGDTLYSIARRFGLEPAEVARQNNLNVAAPLTTGTRLKIKPLVMGN